MKPHPLAQMIFMSRWLQAPLYLGLIFVQAVYVFHFVIEVYELVVHAANLNETQIMMSALGLIDIVLISNLLVMVIIGGYETFVSRLGLHGHPDEPEWLGQVNTGTLKIKLALSLISIASIHLLRTFIDVENQSNHVMMWQVIVLGIFLIAALLIALTDKIGHSHKPGDL